MAKNLQLLKRRIRTAKNVSQIAKAMEMMAASKIKRAQTAVENNKPHAEKISNLTKSLMVRRPDTFHHLYIDGNKSEKKLIIIISPDRGLCGSLNTNLFKKLLEMDTKNTLIVSVGKKAEQIATKLDGEFLAAFPMGTTLPGYSFVVELTNLIEDLYNSGKIGSVEVVYTYFFSFFSQLPVVKKLLPVENEEGFVDALSEDAVFEPSAEMLLSRLLPYYLEVEVYNTLIQAYTSEQVARMLAMQNAKTNANEIANILTLDYNKTRQEKITSEILDLSNNQTV